MLIKLMKHEFRATGRIMLPLYLVLLVTAVGANATTRGLLSTQYRILDMLGVLLVAAFGIAIISVCVMSIVVMVERFYKNLLQDEGYLMMTLPVSVHQQVWAKAIVSTVWFAATVLMVILACLVMAYDVGLVSEMFRAIGEVVNQLTAYYALNGMALFLELLALPVPVPHADADLCAHHLCGFHRAGRPAVQQHDALPGHGGHARGHAADDPAGGALRRGLLCDHRLLLEKQAEPGVNWVPVIPRVPEPPGPAIPPGGCCTRV